MPPNPYFFCLISLPDLGPHSHASGAGDLLRAATTEAAQENVLPEEGEAGRPPRHFGTRSTLLHYGVQQRHNPEPGQIPDVC